MNIPCDTAHDASGPAAVAAGAPAAPAPGARAVPATQRIRRLISGLRSTLLAMSLAMTCSGAASLQAATSPEGSSSGGSPAADAPLADGAITSAVEEALRTNHGTLANDVDVTTSHGIVTLAGSVDSLLIRARTVEIAQGLRGVLGVIDHLYTTPVKRSDDDIRKDILEALSQDPTTDAFSLGVAVDGGCATLSGHLGNHAEVHLAGRIASGVKGVTQVTNAITFAPLAKRSDADIAADVKARLQWNIWLNGDPIGVAVAAGTVTLSGSVGSVESKWMAFGDAWVAGVMAVYITRVSVDAWTRDNARRGLTYASRPDGDIEKAIGASLLLDPRTAHVRIDVSVNDGEATLTGIVGNLEADISAEHDARNIIGVEKVINLLKVRPKEALADEEMTRQLAAALKRSPWFEQCIIQGVVLHRIATLTGVVDLRQQWTEAQDIATRVKGIVAVRNRLRVEPEFPVIAFPNPGSYETSYSLAGLSATPPALSDEQIKRNIDHGFLWSPFVNRDDIHVVVHGGVATLTGTVTTWIAWNVIDHAAQTSGASSIVNQVTITHASWWWP